MAATPSVGERPDARAAGAPAATGTKASGSGLASDPALAAVLEAGAGAAVAAPEQLAFEGPEAIACSCDPMGRIGRMREGVFMPPNLVRPRRWRVVLWSGQEGPLMWERRG